MQRPLVLLVLPPPLQLLVRTAAAAAAAAAALGTDDMNGNGLLVLLVLQPPLQLQDEVQLLPLLLPRPRDLLMLVP